MIEIRVELKVNPTKVDEVLSVLYEDKTTALKCNGFIW